MQRTSISGKENVLLKKVILLKKLLFERSACFEKVHVLNNYLFYSSLFSEASACAGKVFIFKKWQIRKSMCYQKVVITAFRKRTFPKHLEQLLISNTLPLHSIRCSEKKKRFLRKHCYLKEMATLISMESILLWKLWPLRQEVCFTITVALKNSEWKCAGKSDGR